MHNDALRLFGDVPPLDLPFLGDGLVAAGGRVGDFSAQLLPEETPATERMAPGRLAQYSSGRRAAREALAMLGFPDQAVPRRERAPIWPMGIAGSIAHSPELALAVVGLKVRSAGIGVDLEAEGRVTQRIVERILTECEKNSAAADDPTRLFGAKEAVYKAVNPIIGEYLGFQDVELTLGPDGTFRARTTRALRSSPTVALGTGYSQRVAGHWLTAFIVPPLAR